MALEEQVYQRVPVWTQTLLLNAYAFQRRRQGSRRRLRDLLAAWEESQWWEPARLRSQQDEGVRAIVRFAAAEVPFYARRWAEYGLNAGQVQGVADLPKLPVLTKGDVRAAGDELLARGRRRGLVHGHTSGTTGSPLSLWYDRGMVVANNAADSRQKGWGGLRSGDWCALFLGRVVVPVAQRRPPFWRANYLQRQLWCSSFHLSEEQLPLYVQELRARGIRFLEGYPSTIFILARHLLRTGDRLPMRAIYTSSETLHEVQRAAIREAFQARVFDFYGLAERVVFAGECAEGAGKHLFDEYGVTELTDDAGRCVAPGGVGALTGTTLWNRGMPLIRYRTTDLTRGLGGTCPCGRGLARLADVATKAEDIVLTPDGRFVSPSVLTHPFKPFDQILKSQLVQDALDHVTVSIVPSAEFSDAQRAQLEAGLRARLGDAVRIETKLVEDIPPEPSGKFRWVICRVPHDRQVAWEGP